MDEIAAKHMERKRVEEAADWFLRIQGGLSQPDFRKWRRWLEQDAANPEVFDRITSFWQEAGDLDALPWPDKRELAADNYDGGVPLPPPAAGQSAGRTSRRTGVLWLAAAASVAIAVLIGFRTVPGNGPAVESYRTATAEHETLSLRDGSMVTLGAESEIVVDYTRNVRRLELRSGEAYFKVARIADRPFIVAAGNRTVRATGTEFGVNIGVRDIRVSVVEGSVRVEGPPPDPANPGSPDGKAAVSELGEGEVLDFNASTRATVVSEVDPMITTAWLSGRLAYVSVPLESVIADVNRYSKTKLIISDETARKLKFTGTIFSGDIDEWLIGLEKAFPLRLVPVTEHGIVLIQHES